MRRNDDRGFRSEELAGQRTAAMGRSVAMLSLAGLVSVMAPWPMPIFYYFTFLIFVGLGWAAYWTAQSSFGKPWHQYAFVTTDCAWITFILLYPNPLSLEDYSSYLQIRTGIFISFFILLAGLTYLYQSWLVIWGGISTSVSWAFGIWLLLRRPETVATQLQRGAAEEYLESSSNPYFLDLSARVWELAVLVIVACLLALVVRRAKIIAHRQAQLAKEKSNLARYFSAQTAELLANKSALLSQPREHNAAVLFADIVDFTGWSQKHTPTDTIELLREVQELLTDVIFLHHGTLDKFLGDGLMATFGTPEPGSSDATNALSAAIEISRKFEQWRKSTPGNEIRPTKLAVGVHYGPIVIGDIGTADRLEFAVLGDTVNVASRLEQATRQVGCVCLVSADLVEAAEYECSTFVGSLKSPLQSAPAIELRGRKGLLPVFSISAEDLT